MTTIINNNSGIDNVDFSNSSLLGKYVKTNLGNSGVVIREWLCYPEPSEWVLDNGYILNEAQMFSNNEEIIEVEELEVEELENDK